MKPLYNYIMWEAGDRAGKTTAVNTMVNYFKRHDIPSIVFHNGPYDTPELALEAYDEQINEAIMFVKRFNGVVLWDRAHISSHVYGLLVDKKIPSVEDYMRIDHKFRNIGTKLMYAKTNVDLMVSSWYDNLSNELIKMEVDMRRIYAYYDYVMSFTTTMDNTHFDYKRDDIINNFTWLKKD